MRQSLKRYKASLLAVLVLLFALPALAAPPVRLAVMPGGGSGIEQEIVDHISGQFEGDPSVVISTVNPDWYVICNVKENLDQMSGQIRYNGTVTIKTGDGQVVSTDAVQKYNQDFSLQPGAPLNKKLVDNAARDVINGISERAVYKIRQAVETELRTRDAVIKAEGLASQDKYDEAVAVLGGLGPETVHFRAAQKRMAQFQMEKQAKELVQSAEAKAKAGRYTEAVALLKQVDSQSKRHKIAVQMAARYKGMLASSSRKTGTVKAQPGVPIMTKTATNPPITGPGIGADKSQSRLDALIEVEKQSLIERKQQIEKEQAALRRQPISAGK